MKQGSTGLTLRKLQAYHKPAVELTPKQITLWVKELPTANLGESSQSIYRLLVDANQTIIDPATRLSVLNIIEPAALRLVDSLERQYINNHIALTDKQRKIAALVQAIQTELSLGYHAVIESLALDGIKRSNKKLLAQSICLAIKYHGLVILRCYQLYASVPGRVWRELYRLYHIARENQIETSEVEDGDSAQARSCKSYFVQIMLLGTANPYQLRQSEIELVWNLLPKYVEFCSLEAHAYSKHPFFIDLNSNKPPVQKSLYQEKDQENRLKMSVVAIIDKLKIDLAQVNETARYSARKTMVFKHLIHCWSQGTQRSFARTSCQDPINVSIGLGATHYLLTESLLAQRAQENQSDNQQQEPELNAHTLDAMEGSLKDATLSSVTDREERLNITSDRNYLSTSAITSNDVWAKLYRPEQAMTSQEDKEKSIPQRSHDTIVKDSYKIQDCRLVNMSPGGYCIQIAASQLPKHAQTGEIVGFIEGETVSRHWSIGIVRWVRRQVGGNNIQMGVQLLAPDVLPINLQLKSSRSENNRLQRALLLPALTGVGQAATIITNPLAFAINNKVHVTEIALEYEVRLTKEISSSGSSRQFSFDKLTRSQQKLTENKPSKRPNPEDLDGIWDLI